MSDEIGILAAVAAMSIIARRRMYEPKTPEQMAAAEEREREREAKKEAIRVAEEKRLREEMERAPRAFRRRQMKAQRKAHHGKADQEGV